MGGLNTAQQNIEQNLRLLFRKLAKKEEIRMNFRINLYINDICQHSEDCEFEELTCEFIRKHFPVGLDEYLVVVTKTKSRLTENLLKNLKSIWANETTDMIEFTLLRAKEDNNTRV